MAEDINCIKVWHQCIFLQIKWLFMLIPRYKIIFSHQPLWTAHYVRRLSKERILCDWIGTLSLRHNNASFPSSTPFLRLPETLANLFWTQLNHISPREREWKWWWGGEIKIHFKRVKEIQSPLRIVTESEEETFFCITLSILPSNFSPEPCIWVTGSFVSTQKLSTLFVLDYDTTLGHVMLPWPFFFKSKKLGKPFKCTATDCILRIFTLTLLRLLLHGGGNRRTRELPFQWIQSASLFHPMPRRRYLLLWIPFVLIITINDWFGYLNASFRETSLLCHCYKWLPKLCFT